MSVEELELDMEELSSAEDFLEYFEIEFDQQHHFVALRKI